MKGLSRLLDRMENSTIQALERQVAHLTGEKKRLEDDRDWWKARALERSDYVPSDRAEKAEAEVERLHRELEGKEAP